MKKIISIFVALLFLVLLIGCDNTDKPIDNDDDNTASFIGLTDFDYVIGSIKPDYLANVTAKFNDVSDVTHLLLVDESKVDLTKVGTYELRYYIIYNNKTYEDFVSVNVKLDENITLDINWVGLTDFNVIIGDSKPRYLTNISVFINNEDVTDLVLVDDSLIKLNEEGVYQLKYYLKYLNKDFFKEVNVIVSSPTNNQIDPLSLNIFHINDLHGAVLQEGDQIGLANSANLILETAKDEEVIFIANGDILQGQLISNYFYGASVIDSLNYMNLDAFVVGNHEFDWGLDRVLAYFNGTHDIQANFPLLGANIIDKRTNQRPEGIKPYTIVDKGGYRVGIVGLIGQLESSISYEFIKDYQFSDPISAYKKYALELSLLGVDMIIAAIHDEDDAFNTEVSRLTGDTKADVILNAHTHRQYVTRVNDKPLLQSGANGEYIGHIRYEINENKEKRLDQFKNISQLGHQLLTTPNSEIEDLLHEYYLIVESLFTNELMKSGGNYDKDQLTHFMAKAMRLKLGVDIAYHNSGGTRAILEYNESITVAKLHQIVPFDNLIITFKMQGRYIKNLYYSYDLDPSIGTSVYSLNDNTYYTVATHSFIYGDGSNFSYASEVTYTNYFIRDVLVLAFESLSLTNNTFYIDLPLDFKRKSKYNLPIGLTKGW